MMEAKTKQNCIYTFLNDKRNFLIFAYGYFIIPFLGFLLGWVKIWISIPLAVITLIPYIKLFKNEKRQLSDDSLIFNRNSKYKLLAVAIISLIWILFSGIGGFAAQSEDHNARNGMFEALVNYSWPIKFQNDANIATNGRGFSYYFGFWIVPSLFGKLFGLRIGYYAQVAWAFIGILITFWGIFLYRRSLNLRTVLIFVMFSGMDYIGMVLRGNSIFTIPPTEHLEWWTTFQFTSITAQLFWVFNQAIPAWIMTLVFLHEDNNTRFLYIGALSLLFCTLPTIGMIPLSIYLSIKNVKINTKKETFVRWMKSVVSFDNLVAGLLIAVISLLFLWKEGSGDLVFKLNRGGIIIWVTSVFIEIGAYYLLLFKSNRGNVLFHLSVLWLCIIPIIPFYGGYNFCMRASIPALFIIALLVMDEADRTLRTKNMPRIVVLTIVLMISWITPAHEFIRSFSETYYNNKNGIQIRL